MTQDILGSDLAAWAAALATGTYVDDVAIGIAVSLLLAAVCRRCKRRRSCSHFRSRW